MFEYGDTLLEDFDLSGYDTTEYKPYLHYFDANSEFEEEYFGDEYYEPWVSFTSGDSLVHYNKKGPNAPLTFNILSSGTIYWKNSGGTAKAIQYSKDKGQTWTTITSSSEGVGIPVSAGDVLWFKGDNAEYQNNTFSGSTAWFTLEGNAMSLFDSADYKTLLDFSSGHALDWVFRYCTGLTDASDLVLPATGITEYCYSGLFNMCTNLTYGPKLPATILAYHCYNSMFEGCSSLIATPNLPATTLAAACYRYMFKDCTSLVRVSYLRASVVPDNAYVRMFSGCNSLVNPPRILATTMGSESCRVMFDSCTSLVRAPELPATTLGYGCYWQMFLDCRNMLYAPKVLPATALTENCYNLMFDDCYALERAPELPAKTLVTRCYYFMFQYCFNLKYIKCLATDGFSSSGCLQNWTYGVASSGTFVKDANATSWPTGGHGIPNGWTIVDA
jgi:hypothetical protein